MLLRVGSHQYVLSRVQPACAIMGLNYAVPETCPLDCAAKRAAFFATCEKFQATTSVADMLACCRSNEIAWDYLTDECYCDDIPADMPRILTVR